MDDRTTLDGTAVLEEGLWDWRLLRTFLCTRLRTGDFSTGVRLAQLIGAEADAMNHHPDLDLRYPHLDVTLTSHDVDGVTQRDIRLARRISEIASAAGVPADP